MLTFKMQVRVDVNIDNANANSNTIDHLQVIVILWSYLFIIHLYLTHDSTDVLYWIIIQNIFKLSLYYISCARVVLYYSFIDRWR